MLITPQDKDLSLHDKWRFGRDSTSTTKLRAIFKSRYNRLNRVGGMGPNFDAFTATHFLSKQPLNQNFTVFIVVCIDGCYLRIEYPRICVFLCETLHTIAVFV